MKLLIINHYAGSPHHGMENRPFDLAKELAKFDCEVDILCSSYTHLRSNNFSVKILKKEIRNISGIRYVIIGTPKYIKNNIFRFYNISIHYSL